MKSKKIQTLLSKMDLDPVVLPTKDQWKEFVERAESLVSEVQMRLEFTENTLAVSSSEMELMYKRLQQSSAQELAVHNRELLSATIDFQKLFVENEAILDSMIEGFLLVDHLTGAVMKCNQRFFEMWQIPTELTEKNNDQKLLEFVMNQLSEPDQFIELVRRLYATPRDVSFDVLRFKDGRFFERHSTPLIRSDKVLGRLWFFRDITERVNQEKIMESQRAKMVQTSRLSALGEMASGIAHEINNPLTIINGYLHTMDAILASDHLDRVKLGRTIKAMANSVNRIVAIIRGLRAFSRDGSKDPFVPTKVRDMIEDSLSYCRERFKSNNVELIGPLGDLDVECECRTAQISQVMLNFLNNAYDAAKATQDKWIKVEVKKAVDAIEISVLDSGIGVLPELREQVFHAFFTTKAMGQGTGLGLSISKTIVESHNGVIWLDTQSAQTRFSFKIPLRQKQSGTA